MMELRSREETQPPAEETSQPREETPQPREETQPHTGETQHPQKRSSIHKSDAPTTKEAPPKKGDASHPHHLI
ncbi:hypothetical protein [Oceanobacillus picturae]|uniref:hypothetical protein n=1 Tax=Oceanobacillus picturae TaxID=171693 RepID=UPI00056BB28A|nr:hypothetical protein [Oceanobacillus picturae]